MTHQRSKRISWAVLAIALMVTIPLIAQGGGWSLDAVSGGSKLTEGKVAKGATIVVLWASWSPRCRDIVDQVNAIEKRWGSVATVVTVDFQEDASAVKQFLAGQNLAVPVYLDTDGSFSKKYALTTLPGLIVFQDGEARFRGKLPSDPDRVIADLFG